MTAAKIAAKISDSVAEFHRAEARGETVAQVLQMIEHRNSRSRPGEYGRGDNAALATLAAAIRDRFKS